MLTKREKQILQALPATPQDIAERIGLSERNVRNALDAMHRADVAYVSVYVEGEPNEAGVIRWRPLWVRGRGANATRPDNPVARVSGPRKHKQAGALADLNQFFATTVGGRHDKPQQ